MNVEEVWQDIKGYEGSYQVSNTGMVKSLSRMVRSGKWGNRIVPEQKISLHANPSGYLKCTLCKHGKMKSYYVHHLVWVAFGNVKPTDRFTHIDHIDNVKTNNALSNLQLLSTRANVSKCQLQYPKTSRYTGVSQIKGSGKWVAGIRINMRAHHLGRFDSELDASLAYKEALKRKTHTL
jgi:hypothetical protein